MRTDDFDDVVVRALRPWDRGNIIRRHSLRLRVLDPLYSYPSDFRHELI